ncbi:MAG: CvpA family protein [Candidatus Omnitrophica bacterium]|nr:CvpA family protein [Candidatus Omnitrophota bacterium]
MPNAWPNWVDVLIVILFLRACYSGFSRGVEAEIFSLIGAVSAAALACNFHGVLTRMVSPWWKWDPASLDFFIFVAILLVANIGFRALFQLVIGLVKWGERFSWVVQGLGLVLGGVRGLWWSGMLLALLLATGVPGLVYAIQERSMTGDRLVRTAYSTLQRVADWYPGREQRTSVLPSTQWRAPEAPIPQRTFPSRSERRR